MSADDYTPTTEQVRGTYSIGWFADDYPPQGNPGNFDRWLAAHDAEVARAAKAEALEEAANNLHQLGRVGLWGERNWLLARAAEYRKEATDE